MLPPGADDELHDTALEQEIELLAELIDAVAEAGRPLCQAEVDLALGLTGQPTGEVGSGSVATIGSGRLHRRLSAT
ncbi:MAG TPA: hypothetical protein VGN48_09465 [Pedococcus sp.]|jgi:hypothetical protein|nr:hypothetical protein [Pedococcus sp.]